MIRWYQLSKELMFKLVLSYSSTPLHVTLGWYDLGFMTWTKTTKRPSQLRLQNTSTASLQRGKTPRLSVLDMTLKQSDREVSVILELRGIWSTPLLPSLPGPLSVCQWPRRPVFNLRSSHTKDSKSGTWYLLCLTLSIIRYISRVKWSNPGKGVAASPTPRCSSYWKGRFRVAHDYSLHGGVHDFSHNWGIFCFPKRCWWASDLCNRACTFIGSVFHQPSCL